MKKSRFPLLFSLILVGLVLQKGTAQKNIPIALKRLSKLLTQRPHILETPTRIDLRIPDRIILQNK